MGTWYANIAIQEVDQDRILKYCRDNHLEAFVSSPIDGWTFIYERRCNDMDWEELERLGQDTSATFDCRSLCSLNADDDALGLILHCNGSIMMKYDSSTYSRGGAWALAKGMGRITVFPALLFTMQRPSIFAVFRHVSIAKLLRVPAWPSRMGYEYVSRGDECTAEFQEGIRHTSDECSTNF